MDEKQHLQVLREEVKKRRINKILVIPRDRIGDCISETPVFSILRRRFPHAIISALVTPYTHDVIKNNPHVDTIYMYHRMKRFKMGSLLRYMPLFYRSLSHNLIKELDKERFDLIISLFRPIKELRYIFSHIQYRYLINRDTLAHYLADHGITKQTPLYQRNIPFLQALGIDAQQAPGELFWSRDDQAFIDNLFASFSFTKTDRIITVHPGCAKSKKEKSLATAKKIWPFENYPGLLKMLIKELKAKIILTGAQKEEIEANKEIQSQVGKNVHAVSRTTLNQFAYLLSKCTLMLTPDTGALHVAAAVGIPIVALFGPTSIEQYSPIVPTGFIQVITANLSCSPCDMKTSCKENICMQNIKVDEVFHAISKQLVAHHSSIGV